MKISLITITVTVYTPLHEFLSKPTQDWKLRFRFLFLLVWFNEKGKVNKSLAIGWTWEAIVSRLKSRVRDFAMFLSNGD